MTRRALIRVLLLGGVAGLAAACGVKGPLEPPVSETRGSGTFPRQYPPEERPVEGGGGSRGAGGGYRPPRSTRSESKE